MRRKEPRHNDTQKDQNTSAVSEKEAARRVRKGKVDLHLSNCSINISYNVSFIPFL